MDYEYGLEFLANILISIVKWFLIILALILIVMFYMELRESHKPIEVLPVIECKEIK